MQFWLKKLNYLINSFSFLIYLFIYYIDPKLIQIDWLNKKKIGYILTLNILIIEKRNKKEDIIFKVLIRMKRQYIFFQD